MKEDETTQEERRKRRLALAAAGIFVLSLGTFGGLFYLQGQAANSPPEIRKSRSIPDISPAEKQKIIDRANVLRDKWRPWALKHRVELQRMLKAKQNDQKAFNAVWEALPIIPTEKNGGFTFQDLMPTGNPLVGIGFGWGPLAKAKRMKNLRPDATPVQSKIQLVLSQDRIDAFQSHRDIIIAASTKGLTRTELWASGRITQRIKRPPEERPAIYKAAKAAGRGVRQSDILTPHREIVPPFDFLTIE